ncbi:MAG: hypothetical protein AAGJ46_21930 [Planctomycetota bacterium]
MLLSFGVPADDQLSASAQEPLVVVQLMLAAGAENVVQAVTEKAISDVNMPAFAIAVKEKPREFAAEG